MPKDSKSIYDSLDEKEKALTEEELKTQAFDLLSDTSRHVHENEYLDVFSTLKERADFSKEKPKQARFVELKELALQSEDVDVTQKDSPRKIFYIIRNVQAGTYYKVDEKSLFLWNLMDGKHTVRDLMVAYFSKYKSFALEKILLLIKDLKAKNLVSGQKGDVFALIGSWSFARTFAGRLRKAVDIFLHHEAAFKHVDRRVTKLYRAGVKLFFVKPLQILYIVLAIAGIIAYAYVFTRGEYTLFQVGGSYGIGFALLFVLNFIAIGLHESAHAFTTKYYGRHVGRSGIMLYYGMPAAFVDTTDIWFAKKRARMIVSFAGPYMQLILSGIAALALLYLPATSIVGEVLFMFVFLNYLSVFFNLNPLLELDGYYILVDYLEIPALRHKSLFFVRRELPKRFFKFFKFKREEKIYTIFGILSAAWSAFAIWLALVFWQRHVSTLFTEASADSSIVIAMLIIMLIFMVIMPGFILITKKIKKIYKKIEE